MKTIGTWISLYFAATTPASYALDSADHQRNTSSLYTVQLKTIDDQSTTLAQYSGQVLLMVNTASECGYTPQYKGLEALYKKYQKRGLVVLGFPSNDFGGQEPGSNQKIKVFCQKNYQVDFPLFSKASVNGTKIQPMFHWLIQNAPTHEPIGWNFEKFLVSRQGKVVARFKSGVDPESPELISAIQAQLGEKK